ncbi:ABC transporter substrate-binding protein [Paenibacillus turpanensis]|uniref:ABC transporter substrate-binding protein n=1 Tax=Paenibacillus turpanensis TaxID=2689078 RepID=UPI00140E0BEE|nr:ABC transporter substrate-binding protein [Paenibacillus turpanensis]
MSRLSTDYLALWSAYPNRPLRESHSITLQALAEVWFCTPRNAKNIVAKLKQAGWILFEPGLGRGNVSHITLLADPSELLYEEAVESAKAGKIEEALQLIKAYDQGAVKERFMSWLSGYFGHELSKEEDTYIETIRLPIYQPIHTLDPAECFYSLDGHMTKQIYDTLTECDSTTGEIRPALAHSWRCNEAATEWTFFLRKGVRFHHGKELDAGDVLYTFERLKRHFPAQQWLVNSIREVQRLGKYCVRFVLDRPHHLFLHYVAYVHTSIVPSDGAERKGTGPYMLKHYSPGKTVLEVYPDYYQTRGHIDVVEVLNVPESDECIECLTDHSFLLMINPSVSEYGGRGEWEQSEEMVTGTNVLTFNLRKEGPLRDERLRQAITHCIDRRKIVVELGGPRFYPARGFRLRLRPSFTDPDFWGDRVFELLKGSSYQGEVLRMYIYKRHEQDAYWLKSYLESYGIHVEPTVLSWRELLDPSKQAEADLILFQAVVHEREGSLEELMQSGYSFVVNHLSPEIHTELEAGVNRLLAEPTAAGREACFSSIEKLLRERYALVYLVHKNGTAFSHPRVKGIKVNEKGWIDFKNIWFDTVD